MVSNLLRRSSSLIATLGLLTVGSAAVAQSGQTSGSQLPPGEGVPRSASPATLDLRLGGVLTAPAGAAEIGLTLEGIEVAGGLPALEETTRRLLPMPGSTLTLAQVYDFATALQTAYFEAGYPLVRVFVPVQQVDQGRARIKVRVVSGVIVDIDVSGVPERARRPISALTRGVQRRPALTAAELERAVLLAGEVAGITLRSSLMAGRAEGETRLLLAADHRTVQTAVSLDDRLADDLGGDQLTLSMAFNGLLGRGDRIGATVATAVSDIDLSKEATRRYIGVFADVLVGASGLALGADGAISSSKPGGLSSLLALRNEFRRAGVTAVYPTVRNRGRSANSRISLDFIDETQESDLLGFPVTLSRDRSRVLRLSHEEQIRVQDGPLSGTSFGLDLEYSRGLDGLGARRAAEATPLEPLSRAGADAVFDKVVAGLWAARGLGRSGVVVSLDLRGQTGFGDPLLRSEQFSVATPTLISGLPSGAVVGDRALGGRLQFSRPQEIGGSRVVPYLFWAKARADLERPTVLETPEVRLDAYGVGLRGEIAYLRGTVIAFGVEWNRTDATQAEFEDEGFSFRLTFRH